MIIQCNSDNRRNTVVREYTVATCPYCYSHDIQIDRDYVIETGHELFYCTNCLESSTVEELLFDTIEIRSEM